jgi:hypothetical protein
MDMNLELAQTVLEVSEAQPFDFVKLRGRGVNWEAQEMESAGLVVLSAAQDNDPGSVVIKSVTNAGRRLLGILRDGETARCLKRALTETGTSCATELEVAVL